MAIVSKESRVSRVNTPPLKIGVHSETDTLRMAVRWGRPSTETVLAQLYRPEMSLLSGHMDVFKAGEQLDALAAVAREYGVQVIDARDGLSKRSGGHTISKDDLIKRLEERIKNDPRVRVGAYDSRVRDMAFALLERDMQEHGNGALNLTERLCLGSDSMYLPLGNILYARDQTTVVREVRVVSNMAYDIRKPEVGLYEEFYKGILGLTDTIEIPITEKFEAADLYVHGDTVYVRVGPRTTRGAAEHIFVELSKRYKDLTFVMIEDETLYDRPFEEKQRMMHLDMFSMPIGRREMAVCEDEATKSRVSVIEVGGEGDIKTRQTEKNFIEYLRSEKSYDIVAVSKDEQANFGCNILVLSEGVVIVPQNHNPNLRIVEELRKRGRTVHSLPFEQVTNGFGGTHCSMATLLRE